MVPFVIVVFLGVIARLARRFAEPGESGERLRRLAIVLNLFALPLGLFGALEAHDWYTRSAVPVVRDAPLQASSKEVLVLGTIATETKSCQDASFAVCQDEAMGLRDLVVSVDDAIVRVNNRDYVPKHWPLATIGGESMPALAAGERLWLFGEVTEAGSDGLRMTVRFAFAGAEDALRQYFLSRSVPGGVAFVLGLIFGVIALVHALRGAQRSTDTKAP